MRAPSPYSGERNVKMSFSVVLPKDRVSAPATCSSGPRKRQIHAPLRRPRQSGASVQTVEGNERGRSISIVWHPVLLFAHEDGCQRCPRHRRGPARRPCTDWQTPEASGWP